MLVRTQFPDLFLTSMLPALDELIMGRYSKLSPEYTRIFRMMTSDRSIEQTTEMAGLGLFDEVAEAASVIYDVGVPAFPKTYTHLQYAKGFQISHVMMSDDKWGIINKLSTDLGKSAYESKELLAAGIFINGFATNGPDGVPLFSASHPMVKSGGVQSNTLAVAADLDQSSIELALGIFRQTKDHTGKHIRLTPKRLIIHSDNEFAASEILNSSSRSDTANNATNALKHRIGMGPFDDPFVWTFLTDSDAWFILADKADTELRWYTREGFAIKHDTHFDSRSIKTAGWMRHSVGYSNFYGTFGSPGA
jgi:phage major head subunit gpT-like protein